MQPSSHAVSAKSSPVGCSPVTFILIVAFGFFTISASITPLNNLIARFALCPTASNAYYEESSGGMVDKLGVQNDVLGTIVTLHCEYADAPTKEVDNDVVVMTGFGVSAGVGAVVGFIIYVAMVFRSRLAHRL